MEFQLEKKTALVLGGSSGIGLSIAQALASRGADIILVSSNQEKLNAASETFDSARTIETALCDLSSSNAVREFCDSLVRRERGVDILVNNSGGPKAGSIFDVSQNDWADALQANFFAFVQLTKACLPSMQNKQWGRIINISSTTAIEPTQQMIISSSVRAAVSAFSKSIADTVASDGISINTICPGGVETDRLSSLVSAQAKKAGKDYEEVLTENAKIIPAGRYARPEELASLAEYLCCEEAGYLTGRVLSFDGGLLRSF